MNAKLRHVATFGFERGENLSGYTILASGWTTLIQRRKPSKHMVADSIRTDRTWTGECRTQVLRSLRHRVRHFDAWLGWCEALAS